MVTAKLKAIAKAKKEAEAAAEAAAHPRRLQRKGVLVQESADAKGDDARRPRRRAGVDERRVDGAAEEAVDN